MGLFGFKKDSQTDNLQDYHINVSELDMAFSILILDADLNIVHSNLQFSKEFGYADNELYDQNINKLYADFHEEDKGFFVWENLIYSQLSACLKLRTKTGSSILCRLKVVRKENGHFWLFFDKPEPADIHLKNLQESVNLHMQLINNTPDIICFKDGQGRWLLANDADLELFYLKGVDYVGKTDKELAEYTHKNYYDAFLTCMDTDEKCWDGKKLSRGDEIITKPDGSKIVLDVIKIPVFNEDNSRKNLIVFGRDVTARRNAESDLVLAKQKAEESDRLKSNFLATMSHELRTPLNAVIGFANLIYEETDIEEMHEYARIINNNSKMLLSLIEDVFDISLIESDQVQIDHKGFDLVKAISEVYEIFPMELNMLDKLDIEFKLIFDRNSYSFKGDEYRIKQILTNLIRNALKFTKEGYIHVKLDILDTFVDINVIDSGIGISEEKLTEIFGMFRQVEEGYKRSFGGAGLGLTISKKLAEMMSGDILVQSELGKGSVFTLRLPIR